MIRRNLPCKLDRVSGAFLLVAVLGLTAVASGCGDIPVVTGTFDRTLTVNGPVRLELQNGSGDVEIREGSAGEVRIYGEYRSGNSFFGGMNRHARQLSGNPPIEQNGNVIRVGMERDQYRNVVINYRITVPRETSLRARTGSGNMEIRGLRGPLHLNTGSGDITAEKIGDASEINTGSGDVHLVSADGPVSLNTGSGDLVFSDIRGDLRLRTGSGDITISRPGGRVDATTGSGDVKIDDATKDIRVSTGSGELTIDGNPEPRSYWDLSTSSGNIDLNLPSSASFRFFAQSNSGDITTALPVSIEEQGKHKLRGRIGNGDARIEATASSGSIHIK